MSDPTENPNRSVAYFAFSKSNGSGSQQESRMPEFKISDGADEFRIEITGTFSGESVQQVELAWKVALSVPVSRRCTIDISRMSSYDSAGRRSLALMYHHGTQFAAGTPESLVLLEEISGPRRRGPVAVPTSSNPMSVVSEKKLLPLGSLRAAAVK